MAKNATDFYCFSQQIFKQFIFLQEKNRENQFWKLF